MPDGALLDNDVALKIACYSLTSEMLEAPMSGNGGLGMLGVGRFVVRGRLDRATNVTDVARARASLEHLLTAVALLEPDDEELAIAAELEREARLRDFEMDVGESQLLAMLTKRDLDVLITGDKRAIAAMAVVAPRIAAERIACLEQLMVRILEVGSTGHIRSCVCSEPRVDIAITACFACAAGALDIDDITAGLASYIGHLSMQAPGILVQKLGLGPD